MKSDTAALYRQLKTEKAHKGEVASKFKFTDKLSDDYQTLLTAMQDISGRIKALEAEIKQLEKVPRDPDSTETHTVATTSPEAATLAGNGSPFNAIDSNNNWQGPVSYQTLATAEFKRWDSFVAQHPAATTYHRSSWFSLFQQSFGHDTRILVALNEQREIVGGIPLTFFSSKIFGKFAVSIPFVNYGGVVSDYFNIARDLIQKTQTLCTEQQLSHVEIRSMQGGLSDNSLDKKVSMVLKLPASDSALEKQLGSKVRAQYKKAEVYSPSAKIGKNELLDDFYRVFSRNMRDLGTPVYSKALFANILNSPEIKSSILVVYMDRKPVATGFLVGNGATLEIPWASTIQSANSKNANMWMYRQILSYAIAESYEYFDFGRSTMGAGTYKFKKQWGAQAYQHHWYYVMASGSEKPELNPDNPKFKLFIFLWKLMPVWLSNLIGPHVIKHIP